MYTDNPVRDMENYEQRVSEENARRDIFGYCEQCGNAIYRATDEEYGDEYVDLQDGTFIHYECVREWANERKKEAR